MLLIEPFAAHHHHCCFPLCICLQILTSATTSLCRLVAAHVAHAVLGGSVRSSSSACAAAVSQRPGRWVLRKALVHRPLFTTACVSLRAAHVLLQTWVRAGYVSDALLRCVTWCYGVAAQVYSDPDFGTPLFSLDGGASSCQWEVGTAHRSAPTLSWEYIGPDVLPADTAALFRCVALSKRAWARALLGLVAATMARAHCADSSDTPCLGSGEQTERPKTPREHLRQAHPPPCGSWRVHPSQWQAIAPRAHAPEALLLMLFCHAPDGAKFAESRLETASTITKPGRA